MVFEALPIGDYGIVGFSDWTNPRFIVERKSLSDLIKSLTGRQDAAKDSERKRFMREIEKMRQFGWRALLIEARREEVAAGDYRSAATPQSMLASLDAVAVRAGVHLFWAGGHEEAARQLESLVRQFIRGIHKDYRRATAPIIEREKPVEK